MKIFSLYIEKYMKFEKQEIKFNSENISKYKEDFQKELFGEMNITLFCGLNGTGKTSILSFIAKIFRYLQRFRERIPSDFKIHYSIIKENKEYDIKLLKKSSKIIISINDDFQKQIMEYDAKKRKYIKDKSSELKQVTYDNIKSYLPNNILVLGFDIAYEGLSYNYNYYGDRLIEYLNLQKTYMKTAAATYTSLGILKFLYLINYNRVLKKILNIKFLPFVSIYFNQLSKSYEYEEYYYEEFWEKYTILEKTNIRKINLEKIFNNRELYEKLIFLIENEIIYINEYYIEKNSKQISIFQMSTGEKIFLYHLFFIMSNIKENTIIIWEEPETHLNKLWSKQLIPLLTLLYKDLNIHFLISSHETVLINSLFSNQILLLKDSKIGFPDFETFLTNENEIISNISEKIEYNFFEKYIIKKLDVSNQEELKLLLNNIGDSFLKFLIYQKLK
jgi:hypothetical protein